MDNFWGYLRLNMLLPFENTDIFLLWMLSLEKKQLSDKYIQHGIKYMKTACTLGSTFSNWCSAGMLLAFLP